MASSSQCKDRERDRGDVSPPVALLPPMAYVEAALRHHSLQDLIPAIRLFAAPVPPARPAGPLGDAYMLWDGSFQLKYYNIVYDECQWCEKGKRHDYIKLWCGCGRWAPRHSLTYHGLKVHMTTCSTCIPDFVEKWQQLNTELYVPPPRFCTDCDAILWQMGGSVAIVP